MGLLFRFFAEGLGFEFLLIYRRFVIDISVKSTIYRRLYGDCFGDVFLLFAHVLQTQYDHDILNLGRYSCYLDDFILIDFRSLISCRSIDISNFFLSMVTTSGEKKTKEIEPIKKPNRDRIEKKNVNQTDQFDFDFYLIQISVSVSVYKIQKSWYRLTDRKIKNAKIILKL